MSVKFFYTIWYKFFTFMLMWPGWLFAYRVDCIIYNYFHEGR
jgi:hypothetical protein